MTASAGLDMGVALDLAQDRDRRDTQAENSARPAIVTIKHKTTGQGEILAGPLSFGVTYLEPPTMVSGLVLEKLPERPLWRLPLVTVGVMRWDSKPHPGTSRGSLGTVSGGAGKQLYVGAFVYFRIDCYPVSLPDTDGAELPLLITERARLDTLLASQAAGSPERQVTQTQLQDIDNRIASAQYALRLIANPPLLTIEHHLTFTATALKTNLGVEEQATTASPGRTLSAMFPAAPRTS